MTKYTLKHKYIIHLILLAGSLILLTITRGDIAFIFLCAAMVLWIMVDVVFDVLGYSDGSEGVPIIKRFFGYLIGSILFAVLLSMLLRLI